MKRKWMKYMALSLLIGIAVPSFAQQTNEGKRQDDRRKREALSPESRAKSITRDFKKSFQLTDEGYDKVYELYLKQQQDIMPNKGSGKGNMPPRGGMGRPGGGPGGQGGFGGPGGGPGMGNGMPPQGGPQMGGQAPEDMKQQMEKMKKEMEKKRTKAAKTLNKKMKKILSKEQYTQWQTWEAQRNQQPERPQQPQEGF